MSDTKVQGSCLCKNITFEVTLPFQKMVHCHCSRCRKGTGTGHATNLITDPSQFRWLSGEEAITRYDLPNAKSFSKWFCSCCGAPLPRLSRNGKIMVIPAGSIDSEFDTRPTDRIFWGSKAPWSCSGDNLPTHDEYPDSW